MTPRTLLRLFVSQTTASASVVKREEEAAGEFISIRPQKVLIFERFPVKEHVEGPTTQKKNPLSTI